MTSSRNTPDDRLEYQDLCHLAVFVWRIALFHYTAKEHKTLGKRKRLALHLESEDLERGRHWVGSYAVSGGAGTHNSGD